MAAFTSLPPWWYRPERHLRSTSVGSSLLAPGDERVVLGVPSGRLGIIFLCSRSVWWWCSEVSFLSVCFVQSVILYLCWSCSQHFEISPKIASL